MAATVTVSDVLDGHVGLDVECLIVSICGYVPNLQVGGQVVSFLTQHLGNPIPSPAILEKIGTAFRRAVASFAEDNRIGGAVRQARPQDRRDAPISGAAGGDRPVRVAAIGVAQGSRRCSLPPEAAGQDGVVFLCGVPAAVTCYYFYVWTTISGRRLSRSAPISRIR